MGFNSAFKRLKIVKNPGNGRLNNLNYPVLNVLRQSQPVWTLWLHFCGICFVCAYVHSCQMFISVSKTAAQFVVLRGLR